ncbi:hypothetical protein C4J88_1588 [Pseudomonas sp. R4-39-08]|nr:hypothetical protein C4J88_1588 [Pseudomonas sp. R4-39-08]
MVRVEATTDTFAGMVNIVDPLNFERDQLPLFNRNQATSVVTKFLKFNPLN